MDAVTLGLAAASAKKRYAPRANARAAFGPFGGRIVAGRAFRAVGFSTLTGVTFRRVLQMYADVTMVRFVYTNLVMQGTPQENSAGPITMKNSVSWDIAGTKVFVPITFNGVQSVTLGQNQILVSDPVDVSFLTAKNSYFAHLSYITNGGAFLPVEPYGVAQAGFAEGYLSGDFTATDNSFNGGTSASGNFGPTAVVGVASTDVPDVYISGDSIAAGTNWEIGGWSFLTWALHQAQIGAVSGARSGETLSVASVYATGYKRMTMLANGRTHCIDEYGTNDIGASVTTAALKANLLAYWGYLVRRGMKVWRTTIVPRTNSTDSWVTTANQTPFGGAAQELVRQQINQWLRAPATAGAGNSAMFDAGGNLAGVFDTALPLELNADGSAITINPTTGAIANGAGGYYYVTATALATGTVGSIPNSQKLTDNSAAWTANQWIGAAMMITADATTPASVGQVRVIAANTTNTLTSSTAWTTTPSVGASYKIFNVYTQDGIHPTQPGHLRMAAAIDGSKLVLTA